MKINKRLLGGIFFLAFAIYFSSFVFAADATVCCEKTKTGLYCQNVPATECAASSQQAPTSCASTSFCKPGVCYNSNEGTCLDNTPQLVCNLNGGKWSATPLPQCELGCCTLGDQAAFVTLVRCKYLAGNLGLKTNYNKNIKNEVDCVATVLNQDRGACVYDFEFERVCKFTTRSECLDGVNGTKSKGEFFKDKLCTAPELGTKCQPTTKTTCVAGKEGVYFLDNCGNPANIYDASKINDTRYWSIAIPESQSCRASASDGNANSKSCGNCNYLSGSICRAATNQNWPAYGDNICTDLNCDNGKKHGESWCVYDDKGTKNTGKNSVGSRFYRHICINGQEVIEQCADFRQYECIEDKISLTSGGAFSQAACRVNRWQDCVLQGEKIDCENQDKRDCLWKAGMTAPFSNSSEGVCVPKNTPGLKFWEGTTAKDVCAQASQQCLVSYEKGLFGEKKCKQNCDCLKDSWLKDRQDLCSSLGDCGANVNWVGQQGFKDGFKLTKSKA